MTRSESRVIDPSAAPQRRILLVHTGSSYGGVDVYLAHLVALLESDAEFYFFCWNPRSRQLLAKFGARDVRPCRTHRLNRVLDLALLAIGLPLLRRRFRIDTIWAQGGLGILLLPWARLAGFHTVLTRHSALNVEALGGIRGIKHRVMEFISWRLMRFVDRVICVSATVAKGMDLIVPRNKIAVVPNWIPIPAQVDRNQAVTAPLNVLFVGRLERFKGVGFLIEAIRRLDTENAGSASLTIVGEGPCRAEMERLAEGLAVNFAGFQADPAPFYRRADLFVNPSVNPCEGMPLTSLEAMSFGLPCLLSDIPQNKEIVDQEMAALLFHGGDVDDLASKIRICFQSPDLLKTLRSNARNLIVTRFSTGVAWRRYRVALGMG